MAPRAYWTGHIRLSLVSFPVRLYPAVTSTRSVQLHQLDKNSGERIRYQKVVPDQGAVPKEEIVKGYEYEKGHYVTLDEAELEELKVESKHTINLIQFVKADDLDPIYFDKPYYITPDGELAEEAFITVREALRRTGKVALGQIVLSGRERIAALRPCGKGLLLETLRYSDEVRRASTQFSEIQDRAIDEDQLNLAVQLIENKTAKFDPAKFVDHYQEALKDLIAAKVAGREPDLETEADRKPAKVINLMDALKRSLANDETGRPPAKQPPAKSRPAKSADKPARKTATRSRPAAHRKSA